MEWPFEGHRIAVGNDSMPETSECSYVSQGHFMVIHDALLRLWFGPLEVNPLPIGPRCIKHTSVQMRAHQ